MANLAQSQAWVSKRLLDPSGTTATPDDVTDLLNMAVDYWKNRRFWFNEVTDTATLAESNPTIPLPADFLVPSVDDAFVIEYSGIRYPLRKVSETLYNAMYLSNGIGQPVWFARVANSEYQCYPIPDRDYTVRRFWLKQQSVLMNSNDTNDFLTNAPNLIQYTAAAYGMRDFRQDSNMFTAFWEQVKREADRLFLQTRKDNATGSLTLHSIL